MKKESYNIAGLCLIVIGIVLIAIYPLSVTGAVIGISDIVSKISFVIGLVLIIGGAGIIYMARPDKLVRILDNELKSGSVKNSSYLMRRAEQLGCVLKPAGNGYKLFKADGGPLVGKDGRQSEIHPHPGGMAKGTYRSILGVLDNYAHEVAGV